MRRSFASFLVVLLVVIALIGVAIVGSRLLVSPRPPFPTGNGWIAVSANPPGVGGGEDGDIYRVEPGKPQVRIVGSDGDGLAQGCPTFSPDGQRLAYAEARASDEPVTTFRGNWPVTDRAVVVVAADRPDTPLVRTVASAEDGQMLCPRWSPDGRFVATVSLTVVSVIDATSGSRVAIPLVTASSRGQSAPDFAWSRDGTRIAVGQPGLIDIVRLSDQMEQVLPAAGGTVISLAWTANDAGLAYIEDGLASASNPKARLIDLSTGTETALEVRRQPIRR